MITPDGVVPSRDPSYRGLYRLAIRGDYRMTDTEGGCLCSAIRYRVRGEPLHSAICHCKTCRKAAGSPSVAWVTFRRSDFQLLSGSPRVFSSSQGVLRTFCAHCGTPLTYESATTEGSVDVTT